MKNKIAIVTDTNSGITQEEAKKLGIYLIAMPFFINDNTYAKAFIKDKLSSKGSQKIKYDLMKKGIAKDIIEENLIKVDKNEEKEVALNVGRKKYESIRRKESDNYKLSGKLYRFLISRGYAYDIVKDVVKEIMSLDEFE